MAGTYNLEARGPDRSDDDFRNEFLGALFREREVEVLDEQQIDAEPGQFALLDAERRQSERFGRGKEYAARMRFEGQHAGRAGGLPRKFAGPADQYGMTAVQTIEIPHRQDRAGRVVRSGAGMSYNSDHGNGNRAVSRPANCYENSPAAGLRIAHRIPWGHAPRQKPV